MTLDINELMQNPAELEALKKVIQYEPLIAQAQQLNPYRKGTSGTSNSPCSSCNGDKCSGYCEMVLGC